MRLFKTALSIVIVIAALLAYIQKKDNLHVNETPKHHVSTHNLLAISWQNAFCQTHQNKRECRNVTATDFSASHFTLHGLWPQPRNNINCFTSQNIRLDKPLYERLLHVMPAAASGLHQHEWKKHGTCYNSSPEQYFEDSIALLDQINHSQVRDFFVSNTGKNVTLKQVRYAFDRAFGQGSGRKVSMLCQDGLITELHINAEGSIQNTEMLSTLLKNAPIAHDGCQNGRIDQVGF